MNKRELQIFPEHLHGYWDFAVLKKHINGYESTIDNKYFDINKDGIVDDDDWKIGKNFLLCKNNNEMF